MCYFWNMVKEYNEIGSTNVAAKELAESGAMEWTTVIANSQTAGYGRLDHKFYSPSGVGIYMSIILRPKQKAMDALFITKAAGVAVRRAIVNELGSNNDKHEVLIKYVNDILVDKRKVAGILAESHVIGDEVDYVILGIGLNVAEPDGGYPNDIKDLAGALIPNILPGEDSVVLKKRLIEGIVQNFRKIYETPEDSDFLSEYEQYLIGGYPCA